MATCKECLYQPICNAYASMGVTDLPASDISPCGFFKNKADFVEVKRGEWMYWQPDGTNHLWTCSVCNGAIVTPMPFVAKHIAYCEHCGADMRKEGADNGR